MRRLLHHLMTLAALGCSPWDAGPTVDGIQPTWGYNGEETVVEIAGERFFAGVGVSGGEIEAYNRDFMVSMSGISSTDLGGVRQVSTQTLEAVVPQGLAPGWYDLTVVTPAGGTAVLVDGFEVTATRADSIRVDIDSPIVAVQEVSIVHLTVVDPDGSVVPEAIEVQVSVTPNGDGDASALGLNPSGLNQVDDTEDGRVVTGLVNPTGEGFVGVTASAPMDVWVEVTANIRGRPTLAARELISFRAGSVVGVDVRLPEGDFTATAGRAFDVDLTLVDGEGNPVTGQAATLALTEGCAGGLLSATHTFVDATSVSLTVTKACEANSIRVFGAVDGAGVEGASDEFFVGPGTFAGLDVFATPDNVRAGVDEVTLFVQAIDEWGNSASAPILELVVSDEIGPLSEMNGNGRFDCDSTFIGAAQCVLDLYVASEGSPVTVETSSGISGLSNPVQVLSGPGESVEVEATSPTMVAGVGDGVILSVIDAFGNPLFLTPVDLGSLVFSDDDGPVDCIHLGSATDDFSYSFQCTFFEAGLSKRLFVQVPTLGAIGQSAYFDVMAGPLDSVTLTIDEDTAAEGLVAGDTLLIAAEGFDEFGNRVGGEVEVQLNNVGGGLLSEPLTLTDGVGAEIVGVTHALQGDSIWAWRDGVALGGTRAFDVSPGPVAALSLTVAERWGFVGVPWPIQATLVDDYGNSLSSGPYPFFVDSIGGLIAPLSGTMASGSVIEASFTSAGIGDTVEVTLGGFTATLSEVDVGLVCDDERTAAISVVGHDDGRICLDSAGFFEGTVAWFADDVVHATLSIGSTLLYRGTATDAPLEIKEAGREDISGFLLDGEGCGMPVSQVLYSGFVGEPVGLVASLAGADALIGGSAGSTGATNIDVTALQCSGDEAAHGSLKVWVDIGELEAVDGTALVSTGGGKEIELDSEGEGTIRWSVTDVDTSADGSAFFGSPDGAAYGQETVAINGDSRPPRVLYVNPGGHFGGTAESIVVSLSEQVFPTGLDSSSAEYLALTDMDENPILLQDVWLDSDGRTLVIEPEVPLDGSADEWRLVITDDVRDHSGNRLDGDYDGIPGGDWIGAVGATPMAAPDVLACGLASAWFQPDNDDGPGMDGDYVWVEMEATGPSDWWRLDVYTQTAHHVHTEFFPRSSPVDGSLTWDGRGADGRIVSAGRYVLDVAAVDEFGGSGAGCAASVVVSNLVEAP